MGVFAGALVNLLALFCLKPSIWRGMRGCTRDLCNVGGGLFFVVGVLLGASLQTAIIAFLIVELAIR